MDGHIAFDRSHDPRDLGGTRLEPAPGVPLSFRGADERDLSELVRIRDGAARRQIAWGIDQWKPGELGEDHFRTRIQEGEVWIATLGPGGPAAGAFELWWADPAAWGPQPPNAGYVHRLMTDHRVAAPGTGRLMLAEAERRIAAAGLPMCRLDCRAGNARLRRYYAAAGYTERGERVPRNAAQPGIYTVTLLEKDLTRRTEKGLENGNRDA